MCALTHHSFSCMPTAARPRRPRRTNHYESANFLLFRGHRYCCCCILRSHHSHLRRLLTPSTTTAAAHSPKTINPADTSLDKCGRNDIKVAFNPCGCVYAFDLDSQMTATSVYGLVCGIPATYNGTVAGNKCHVDSIASPDNVAYIDGHDQLLIGEDTGLHTNDVLWSFDLTTKRLTRIWTTPYGSETTSPYWYTGTS